jgi:hypothetical protein
MPEYTYDPATTVPCEYKGGLYTGAEHEAVSDRTLQHYDFEATDESLRRRPLGQCRQPGIPF